MWESSKGSLPIFQFSYQDTCISEITLTFLVSIQILPELQTFLEGYWWVELDDFGTLVL